MLFIKRYPLVLWFALTLFVSACAPVSSNKGDNITPLDEAERQTTTDYAEQYSEEKPQTEASDSSAAQLSQKPSATGELAAAGAEPVLTAEERFGINPYLASPPIVAPAAKESFDAAMAKFEQGDAEAAVILLEQMQVDYPELSGPSYNLAVFYYKQDKPEQALQAIENALKANENNFDARNLQAKIYRDNSEFSKAETAYLDILNRWGGYLPAYKNLGIMYDLYMGKPEKALSYYQLYNQYTFDEDKQAVGWQVVIERQLKAQQMREQALAEQQAAREAETDSTPEAADNKPANDAQPVQQEEQP